MPEPQLPRAAFDALLRHAGIDVSAAKADELYAAYGTLELLCERLRMPLPPEVEPATIFVNEVP